MKNPVNIRCNKCNKLYPDVTIESYPRPWFAMCGECGNYLTLDNLDDDRYPFHPSCMMEAVNNQLRKMK